jgi:hypothetical protein
MLVRRNHKGRGQSHRRRGAARWPLFRASRNGLDDRRSRKLLLGLKENFDEKLGRGWPLRLHSQIAGRYFDLERRALDLDITVRAIRWIFELNLVRVKVLDAVNGVPRYSRPC